MTILLLGDSHLDQFVRMPNVVRFDLSKCNPYIFTSYRFINSQDIDLWSKLDYWFSSYTTNSSSPAKILIITAGEIDIRVHYWRHIPRQCLTTLDLLQFIKDRAVAFYNKLTEVRSKYNLDHIIVWGAPVAGEKAQNNSEYPFSGSSLTRNKIIHLWNREFANLIIANKQFSLASAYYDFINPVDYSTLLPYPSHDGVHWIDSYGSIFWEKIITPAMSKQGLFFGEQWNKMCNDKFYMSEEVSQGIQQYDTWARSDQCLNINGIEHHTQINSHYYSWIKSEYRSKLPDQYTELSLKKV